MTREGVVDMVIMEKVRQTSYLHQSNHCNNGQLNQDGQNKVFDELFKSLNKPIDRDASASSNGSERNFTDDDMKSGFMIYSAVVYCSKLDTFLDSLLTYETPRTIIRAIINTFESENIKPFANEKMVSEFYIVFMKVFNLEYERILLATGAPLHLPFLLPYREGMDTCINGSSCHQINQAIDSLGKTCTVRDRMPHDQGSTK